MKELGRFTSSGIDKKEQEGEARVRMVNYMDIYGNPTREISKDRELMSTTCPTWKVKECSLQRGDLVFTPSSETEEDIGLSALITDDLDETVFSYHVLRFRFAKELDISFRKYLCNNPAVLDYFSSVCEGTTRQILTRDDFKNAVVLLPTAEEQRAIAEFLDRETGKIDELIAKKERLIELLEEKRAALVTRAVTRGLNPDAPLRDSGVEWLGQIPAHWEVKRSKQVLIERNDRSTTGDEEMLTVSHITGVTPRSEKEVNMFEAETTEGYKLVSPNNLVINTLWAWMGAMGVSRHEGIVSPAYHVYRIASDLLPEFVDYLVHIDAFKSEVTRFSKGVWSSRLRLYPHGLYEVILPIPPFHEQRAIAAHLKAEQERSGALQTILRSSIKLLQERRSALITAAATGKIDVRAAVSD